MALDPVPSVPRALAPGTGPFSETGQSHGKARLENFGVGDRGVGHVNLHGGRSFLSDGSSGPAPDGFVMAEGLIPEGQVVHRPLRTGNPSEGAEDEIDDPLADFDVTTRNPGTLRWVIRKDGMKKRAFGDDQVHGFEQAFVERKVLADEQAQAVTDLSLIHI